MRFLLNILFILLLCYPLQASKIDSLKSVLKKTKGKDKIEVIFSLASTYEPISPVERGQFAELGYKLALESLNDSLIAVGLKNMALSKYYLQDFDSTTYYFQAALEQYRANKDTFGISVCIGNLGMLYQNNMQFANAIDYYLESKELKEKRKDTVSLTILYSNLVSLYFEMEDTDQALEYNKLVEHLNNTYPKMPKDFSPGVALNYGAIYLRMSQKHISKSFKDIEQVYLKKDNYTLNDSARFYLHLSKENYEKALKYYSSVKDSINLALVYQGIGNYLMIEKNFEDSFEAYFKALDIYTKYNSIREVARVLTNIAYIYSKISNFKKSLEYYQKADSIATIYSIWDVAHNANEALYKYYYLIGDKSKAIEPLMKLNEIEDSLDIQNIKYRLNKLKAQESISRKDYQIQLLEKDKKLLGRERLILFILISIVIVLAILLYARFRYKAKTNKQLESKNKDLQLLNTALEESKIELTDTNNAKDKMFSIIAHDLRNPVGSLRLMSGMLVEEYHSFSEEERIDFLNSLKDSTDKVYNLMENLLTWSRSQRGKIECHPVQTNLFRLVENVKDSLKNNADSKNITVYNLVKTELEMIIDPNLTATIVRNLLSNSIKFSEDNTDITIESKTSHNECTEIIIRDQGIGMSKDQINKLFALDSNNTTKGTKGEEGTGLGLLLCKEFAELQGGNIRVESKQGVGSTFYLCLNNIETPLP